MSEVATSTFFVRKYSGKFYVGRVEVVLLDWTMMEIAEPGAG